MREAVKLLPFHDTVQTVLVQATLGFSMDEGMQGQLYAILTLIEQTEIPTKALLGVSEVCSRVRDGITKVAASQSTGVNRQQLEALASFAAAVVVSLDHRAKQKAEEAPPAETTVATEA